MGEVHQFPLLHQPRPWKAIHAGATSDARWTHTTVPYLAKRHPNRMFTIQMSVRLDLQRKARKAR